MAEPKQPDVEILDSKKDYYTPQGDEHEEGVIETGALTVINAAEINQQVATARRYPRSPTQFRRKVFELVTYNMDVAESCIYAIPRDGKMIDGPSIRFAENLQIAWGNCRSGTEVTDIGDEFVTAEGIFFDLETNSATKAKIMRRITTKTGKRFSADMIATTGNAACSIALRNAILRGVPKSLWYELFDEAKKVAGGTQQTFGARRDRVVKDLGVQGATPDMIFALLGVTGIEDIKTEHVVHLRGLQNAIKDGETTLEAAFAHEEGLKPGEVAPKRPERSEFTRDAGKPEDKKPAEEAKPLAGGASESMSQGQTSSSGGDLHGERTGAANPNTKAWQDFKDAAAEKLAEAKLLKEVAAVRENFAAEFEGEDAKWWEKLCDARQKAVMEERIAATGAGKKK